MDRARRDSTKRSGVESAILGDGPQEQTAEIRMRIYSYQKEQMNDTRRLWRERIRVLYTKRPCILSIQKVITHAHSGRKVDLRRDGDRLINSAYLLIFFRRTLEHHQARVMINYGLLMK